MYSTALAASLMCILHVRALPNIPHKHPLILLPGFASTRLQSWSSVACNPPLFSFEGGADIWIHVAKVIGARDCWLQCMLLDPYTLDDGPTCRTRPDEGLDAIKELEPGIILGRLSSVWKEFIVETSDRFGYTPFDMIAMPYDFRLSPHALEDRDGFYTRLRYTIQFAVKIYEARNGDKFCGGVAVLAHSLGNNVFRYFLEWLRLEFDDESEYQAWLDRHIATYFALGPPFLGAIESVRAYMSGITFGLPMPEPESRKLGMNFGSTLWMSPFMSDHDFSIYAQKFPGEMRKDVITVIWKDETRKNGSYTPEDLIDGTMFRDLEELDATMAQKIHQLREFYHQDPIMNPLTPWKRPPIKKIIIAYGIGLPTPGGYVYRQSGEEKPHTWDIEEIVYEAGDGSVPHSSLAWGHTWLGPNVIKKTIPRRVGAYDPSEVGITCELDQSGRVCTGAQDYVAPPMEPRITMYEDHGGELSDVGHDHYNCAKRTARSTAIWELDNVDHREILRSPEFIQEALREIAHGIESSDKEVHKPPAFAGRLIRPPKNNADCTWNYWKAQCNFLDFCEYRYKFGDVHLSQSCRFKRAHTSSVESTEPTKATPGSSDGQSPAITEELLWGHLENEAGGPTGIDGQCPNPDMVHKTRRREVMSYCPTEGVDMYGERSVGAPDRSSCDDE